MAQEIKPTPIQVGAPQYGGTFAAGGQLLPFVLPGELVAQGALVRASPDRVAPKCVHFGTCGGCHYQHAAYPVQLEWKREILAGLLADAGLRDLPPIRTHAAEPWGYRNRIRLRVQGTSVGYSLRGTTDFLPITMCPIAAPLLGRAAETLTQLTDPLSLRWLASTAEVELFCLPNESRLQAHFLMRDPAPAHGAPDAFASFCAGWQTHLPELAGAGAELDPELNRRVRRAWEGATWGTAGLSYPVAAGAPLTERSYWVARGAFFQVNRFLVERLVELVCTGQQGSLAWDLFAGVGLFTRALAESFPRVVAVEGGEAAAAALAVASKSGKSGKLFDAVRSPTLDFLRAREPQRERPDLVVLDPPRAGLGLEGVAILARIAPARIVYVSCDPTTLARDLAVLLRGGYRIAAIDLLDLFPQTYHLETVVHLLRA